jgi:hypothetical protein
MIVKLPDESIEMRFTTAPDRIVPHLDPVGYGHFYLRCLPNASRERVHGGRDNL